MSRVHANYFCDKLRAYVCANNNSSKVRKQLRVFDYDVAISELD